MSKKPEFIIGGEPTIVNEPDRVEMILCDLLIAEIRALASAFEVPVHLVCMSALNAVAYADDLDVMKTCKQGGMSHGEASKVRIELANLLADAMRYIVDNGPIKHATQGCGDPECKACETNHPTTTKE